jgi:Secretion system C-terminal sorting domain
MKKIWITLAFCAEIAAISAQKHDNVWPGGFTEYPGQPLNGNFLMRFDNGAPTVQPANLNMNFESTVAAFSDSTGQLRFYSNGCNIANAAGQILYHQDLMNPGTMRDLVCPDIGYISPNGAMFLPWPGRENINIILLHMSVDYHPDRKLTYGPLYWSVLANEPGILQEVNGPILDVIYQPSFNYRTYEPFSVVRHGNGRDWWIVVPQLRKNKYHVLLLSPLGIKEYPLQIIGPDMKCRRVGSSVFSPNGSRYARLQNCGATVMDFNRCTGKFSSPVWLPLPAQTFGGGSVAFSDDGSQLITDGYLTIYKADLDDANPAFDTLVRPAQIRGRSLQSFQRGPDGKLYFSLMNRSDLRPVLSDPFGDDFDFDSLGVRLPNWSVRGLPYFPNFRLYDFPNSPCDTLGINTPVSTTDPRAAEAGAKVWPNPFKEYLTISPESSLKNLQFKLYDPFGRIVVETDIAFAAPQTIEVGQLPPGMYWWVLKSDGLTVGAGKVVKAGE